VDVVSRRRDKEQNSGRDKTQGLGKKVRKRSRPLRRDSYYGEETYNSSLVREAKKKRHCFWGAQSGGGGVKDLTFRKVFAFVQFGGQPKIIEHVIHGKRSAKRMREEREERSGNYIQYLTLRRT